MLADPIMREKDELLKIYNAPRQRVFKACIGLSYVKLNYHYDLEGDRPDDKVDPYYIKEYHSIIICTALESFFDSSVQKDYLTLLSPEKKGKLYTLTDIGKQYCKTLLRDSCKPIDSND